MNHEHPAISSSAWSKDETRKLKHLVQKYNERDWMNVAAELDTGRTPAACLSHYRNQQVRLKVGSWQNMTKKMSIFRRRELIGLLKMIKVFARLLCFVAATGNRWQDTSVAIQISVSSDGRSP